MTRETAEQLIAASRPPAGRRLANSLILPMMMLVFLFMAMGRGPFAQSTLASIIVPWALVIGLISWRWILVRRQRETIRQITQASEAAEMNEWSRVGEIVRALLTRGVGSEGVRAQAMLLLAGSTERAKQYDVSELLFETILRERRADALQLHQATIGLAAVKLRSEQLTDAVQILDRLRKVELPGTLRAGVELVRLFQEVLMGHYDVAVSTVETRKPLFRRHLSTRAGYGYALYAAATHALGRVEEAAAWWRDATLLLRPQVLVERYDLLGPVAQQYPASEIPI